MHTSRGEARSLHKYLVLQQQYIYIYGRFCHKHDTTASVRKLMSWHILNENNVSDTHALICECRGLEVEIWDGFRPDKSHRSLDYIDYTE